MDDLSGILSGILNSPEGIENLKKAAEALLSDKAKERRGQSGDAIAEQLSDRSFESCPDISLDQNGLPDISPSQLAGIIKVISTLKSRGEDDRTKLLIALKPHLSPERRERVDQAVKFLKIIDIIPLIRGSGLL